MSKTMRNYDKYEYFMDDLCENCLFFKGKSKRRKHGCEYHTCCYEVDKRGATVNGRITGKRGFSRWRE